jgi:hypothetical protein
MMAPGRPDAHAVLFFSKAAGPQFGGLLLAYRNDTDFIGCSLTSSRNTSGRAIEVEDCSDAGYGQGTVKECRR